MRAGVIDIGSNSIKLVIGEMNGDDVAVLETLKNVVPIGKDTFFRGRISQETINQTVGCLEKYKQLLREYDVSNLKVIATTAVREARNRDIFVDAVSRRTGFSIDVLNVGDVVYYIDSFLYHKLRRTYPVHNKNLVIAELGAGNLDISVLEKGSPLLNSGIAIGTLRLKQFMSNLDGSVRENNEALQEYVEYEIVSLKKSLPTIKIDDLILIDESYAPYLSQFLELTKKSDDFFQVRKTDSEILMAKMIEGNPEALSDSFKIPVDIAETIGGYSIILNKLFKLIKNRSINILKSGLPEAILTNLIFQVEQKKQSGKTEQLISVAKNLCRKFKVDYTHACHVADLSKILFENLKDLFGLQDEELIYLLLAAYLHDIGTFINNRSHHKHTEYVVTSLNMFRLTEDEMKVIACVARYHRRANPSGTHYLYSKLDSGRQILIQKLSALLRVANALDRSHRQKVKKLEVSFNKRHDVNLTVYTDANFILEKVSFMEKKGLFEEMTGSRINLTIRSAMERGV